jgi:hypothetical protein
VTANHGISKISTRLIPASRSAANTREVVCAIGVLPHGRIAHGTERGRQAGHS